MTEDRASKVRKSFFFRDLITSESDRASYKKSYADLSAFLDDCVRHLAKALRRAVQIIASRKQYHDASIGLLIRHVCEFCDGVSVLVAGGSSQPCVPVLRSAFEAFLGLCYILNKDARRRGLAYQIGYTHQEISRLRNLQSTPGLKPQHQKTYQEGIDRLSGIFSRPEYAEVEEEWKRTKENLKRRPSWFSLFDGPRSVEDLAKSLKFSDRYNLLYRTWSATIHASDSLSNLGTQIGTAVTVRPIRHPEGLDEAVFFAAEMCINLSRQLVSHYMPEQKEEFKSDYEKNLRSRFLELGQGRKLINAPWR